MEMISDGFERTAARFGWNCGISVLLVEDDDTDAYLIGRVLSDNDAVANISRAKDGLQALAMVEAAEVSPDLALIDLHMPRMDGLELLVAFANLKGPRFPMIVVTSSSSQSDALRARLRSAVQVVVKPDTVTELDRVLKDAIEGVIGPGGTRTKGGFGTTTETPMGRRSSPGLDGDRQ